MYIQHYTLQLTSPKIEGNNVYNWIVLCNSQLTDWIGGGGGGRGSRINNHHFCIFMQHKKTLNRDGENFAID